MTYSQAPSGVWEKHVSLSQWKIALEVESRPRILKVSYSKGAMNSDFYSSRIKMVDMYIFLDQLGFHM